MGERLAEVGERVVARTGYCVVHRSLVDEDGCHWDRLAGYRPGRGGCQVVQVRIVQEGEECG